MTDLKLPPHFRITPIRQLVERLRAGESCSVIGVGDSGKSNVARHLNNAEVRELHWGSAAPGIIYLYVDCNKLSEYTEYSIFALILEVLAETLAALREPWKSLHTPVEAHWRQAVQANNGAIARHELEHALHTVFDTGATQIVIALDDFDQVIEHGAPALLKNMRALRDDFKLKIVYATFTRKELDMLTHVHTPEYEAFSELFLAHIIPVAPYTRAEGLLMLERLAARQDASPRALSDAEKERLLDITGGHAGLIRAAYSATQRGALALDPDIVHKPSGNKVIQDTCAKIVASLDNAERGDLVALAQHHAPAGLAFKRLTKKGLLVTTPNGMTIFAPLFENYLATLAPTQIRFVLNGTLHTVSINQRVIALDFIEFALFTALLDKRPHPVPRSELIARLMNTPAPPHVPGYPERRLEFYLAQLKRKIDPPGKPYIITTPDAVRLVDENGN